MTHDEFCPYSQPCPVEWRSPDHIVLTGPAVPHRIVSGSSGRCVECETGDCVCYLIARVRADERERGKEASALTAYIECPECGAVIPVEIEVRLDTDDDGNQVMFTEPDMADLWAHAWAHNGGSNR